MIYIYTQEWLEQKNPQFFAKLNGSSRNKLEGLWIRSQKIIKIKGHCVFSWLLPRMQIALKLATCPPPPARFKINSSHVLCIKFCTCTFPFTLFFVPVKKKFAVVIPIQKAHALDGQRWIGQYSCFDKKYTNVPCWQFAAKLGYRWLQN